MPRENMADRLLRESRSAADAHAAMKGKPAIERLIEAATRSIRANADYPVGKDGKTRLSISKITAEGDIAEALRELGKNV